MTKGNSGRLPLDGERPVSKQKRAFELSGRPLFFLRALPCLHGESARGKAGTDGLIMRTERLCDIIAG
jgi:hypothetical protein